MSRKFSGSCLCGALRFEASVDAIFQGFCQCTDCRKVGSAHCAVIGLPSDAVKVTGKYTTYGKKGDSGKIIYRHFCPTCGGVAFDKADAMSGVTMVNAALLDDPSMYKPQSVVYTRSAVSWDHMPPGLVRFATLPPTA